MCLGDWSQMGFVEDEDVLTVAWLPKVPEEESNEDGDVLMPNGWDNIDETNQVHDSLLMGYTITTKYSLQADIWLCAMRVDHAAMAVSLWTKYTPQNIHPTQFLPHNLNMFIQELQFFYLSSFH